MWHYNSPMVTLTSHRSPPIHSYLLKANACLGMFQEREDCHQASVVRDMVQWEAGQQTETSRCILYHSLNWVVPPPPPSPTLSLTGGKQLSWVTVKHKHRIRIKIFSGNNLLSTMKEHSLQVTGVCLRIYCRGLCNWCALVGFYWTVVNLININIRKWR